MTILESGASGSPGSSSRRQSVIPKAIDGFEILSLLGTGGMGAVFLAYEPLLDRTVALKLLSREENDQARAQAAARFLSEAVLTGRLGHAGIVPIYKIGFDNAFGYYYVMRYVKGQSLLELLHQLAQRDSEAVRSFSLNRLLTIFLRVCEAIAFAHRHGIVHRDIKPANIMLAEFGEVLVLDWGLARDLNAKTTDGSSSDSAEVKDEKLADARKKHGSTTQLFLSRERNAQTGRTTSVLKQLQAIKPSSSGQERVTKDNLVLGTPGYLSPEQGAGKNATPASDVYSLGVLLYEMLTHHLPIECDDINQLIVKTVMGEIVPIERRPNAARIPKALCAISMRALALKSEDRYKDASELADEISLYLEGRGAWRNVAADPLNTESLSTIWDTGGSKVLASAEGVALHAGQKLRCIKHADGDFRCGIEFWSLSPAPWEIAIAIAEILDNKSTVPRYEFRLGVSDRPCIELRRNGHRVQRRLDFRMQGNQRYALRIEMEEGTLRLSIDDRKIIEFQEVFPQIGGAIELSSVTGVSQFRAYSLSSRGAPLNLSFMVLPDRLYRSRKFSEARELYRQLATSHPDREEGVIARYKAGLCSTALNETQDAFDEFTRLEGTMYDHCCALGLAQIGMLDGNIEWAWEALKNGFHRHAEGTVRHEIWLALIGCIESIDPARNKEKIDRYRELIVELDPEPQELGRIACELLELVQASSGRGGLRTEALRLLMQKPESSFVVQEALLAVCRAGIDNASIALVKPALESAMKQRCADSIMARFHILRAEILISEGKLDDAYRELRDCVMISGLHASEGLWAKGWQAFIHHVNGRHLNALTEAHEALARIRRTGNSQAAYLRLIEGLSYLGKKQSANADAAFAAAAETEGMWALAARHVLERGAPENLLRQVEQTSSSQLAEALFLSAEAHSLRGDLPLAHAHYHVCLRPEIERAMFAGIAQQRMSAIEKIAG